MNAETVSDEPEGVDLEASSPEAELVSPPKTSLNSISDSKVEFREAGVGSKAVATETRYNRKLTQLSELGSTR
jgi:hypothetical protein